MSDGDSDIKDDKTTSFAVLVPKSATDATTRDYLRLGDVDPNYESKLLDPTDGGSGTTLSPQPGALIYSTEQVTLAGPTVTQIADYASDWSNDNLSVVGIGADFTSATWTGHSKAWPVTTTFQRANDFNTTLGSTTNLLTGNSMTQWLGNAASTGTGGLLWSNYGHTQNVFGGQIVNIINNAIDVQGFGETKIVPDYSVVSPGSITFGVTPAAAIAPWASLIGKIAVWGGLASALVQDALTATTVIEAEVAGTRDNRGPEHMKNNMIAVTAEIATASTAILVMQAMAIIAGIAAAATAKAEVAAAIAGIAITDAGVTISAGATQVTITSAGLLVNGVQVSTIAAVIDQQADEIVLS